MQALLLLALAMPSTTAASTLSVGWREYTDTNCVYSRLSAGPGKDSGDVHYLGKTPTLAACVALAHIDATHAAVQYHSLAWHGALQGPYFQQCYGVAGKEWLDKGQKGVTTLRGPKATLPPAPSPPGPPPPTPAPTPGPCTDAAGCNHNGKCTAGKCTCSPQFKGAACDLFNFAPLDLAEGSGLRSLDKTGLQISSWGGSVHLADDGKYHMWAAEMTEYVGIKAWITNSQVVHAVADSPSASPYKFTRREVVAPVFAHEPTVSRAPTGEWVMFYTSNYGETPGSQCNPPCSCGHNGTCT